MAIANRKKPLAAFERLKMDLAEKRRELRVQSAQEKVRTVALRMRQATDMLKICRMICLQLEQLGVSEIRNIQTALFSRERGTYRNYEYYARHKKSIGTETRYDNHPITRIFANKMLQGKGKFYIRHLRGDQVKEWIAHQKTTNVFIDSYLNHTRRLSYYWYSLGPVALGISTYKPLSPESKALFMRFLSVFELAYRRYLDIDQALSQAREARVEASLEKVRAIAMGMKKPADLLNVCETMYREFTRLGFDGMRNAMINIHDDAQKTFVNYDYSDTIGKSTNHLAYSIHPLVEKQIREIRSAPDAFSQTCFTGKDLAAWTRFRKAIGEKDDPRIKLKGGLYYYFYSTGAGSVGISTFGPLAEDKIVLLRRFRNVFTLSYRRYADIAIAESQAREAEIQLALERVRARTMAMQNSAELSDTVYELFQQFRYLGEDPDQATIGIVNEADRTIDYWVTMYGQPVRKMFRFSITEPHVTNKIYEAWKLGKKSLVIDLRGKALQAFMKYRAAKGGAAVNPREKRRVINVGFFQKGLLNVQSREDRSEESLRLLERFATVFDQTYTRFLDLKTAEAQVKEAQIENALEKVRSRTLAMQRSEELAQTASVLFQQLILLGIEPNRLYIGITEKSSPLIEFWTTDEDGSRVGTMFRADASRNASMKKMLRGWEKEEKTLVMEMQGKELQEYFRYLVEELQVPFREGLSQKRRWQYIAYFSKGFIGMAAPDEQPPGTLHLLERFAFAFNLTFTRFNDLKLAEAQALQAEQDLAEIKAARKKAEDALTELQATQAQLVQSEKMASLGELTAGIAHEIQNPLNFVNNFSEVSSELIDEMKQELSKGNADDAIAIAGDVQQNLAKISFHGKRADGIVKSMLEHSRTASGKKELTDINQLADEYARLSFHGMRAKDDRFQVVIRTEFDPEAGRVILDPQAIGRVLLNLLNNAFYSVNERKKTEKGPYQPAVTIRTARTDHQVAVMVSDNGTGIPQSVRDKIFQPFFTTKPTGQGTGLGLSLAYDIITKEHRGVLQVDSRQGEDTTFTILLNG